jgi:hypothetical protein
MPRITVLFSLGYIALGLVGYLLTGGVHMTALIPAFVGVILLVLGLLGQKKNLRAHVMHAALLIGLLALLGTARSLLKLPAAFDGTAERPEAISPRPPPRSCRWSTLPSVCGSSSPPGAPAPFRPRLEVLAREIRPSVS